MFLFFLFALPKRYLLWQLRNGIPNHIWSEAEVQERLANLWQCWPWIAAPCCWCHQSHHAINSSCHRLCGSLGLIGPQLSRDEAALYFGGLEKHATTNSPTCLWSIWPSAKQQWGPEYTRLHKTFLWDFWNVEHLTRKGGTGSRLVVFTASRQQIEGLGMSCKILTPRHTGKLGMPSTGLLHLCELPQIACNTQRTPCYICR